MTYLAIFHAGREIHELDFSRLDDTAGGVTVGGGCSALDFGAFVMLAAAGAALKRAKR
jgi:hypothetical protein